MAGCAGIKADGGRCGAQAIRGEDWCFNHHPGYEEQRRRRGSRGGKRGGRGRPMTEVADVKRRLLGLADDVLDGSVGRGDAAVASQILNVYLRAAAMELKIKEVEELERRLEELEAAAREGRGGRQWGT